MKNFIINIKKYIKEHIVIFLSTCITIVISPYILANQVPGFIYFIAYFNPTSVESNISSIKIGILSILLIYIILFYIFNKKVSNKKAINISLCIIFILITMSYTSELVLFGNAADGLGYCRHMYKDLEILKYPKDKQEHADWVKLNKLDKLDKIE